MHIMNIDLISYILYVVMSFQFRINIHAYIFDGILSLYGFFPNSDI